MPDRFEANATGLEAPASHGFAVTPNDSTDLAETTRAIYIGTPGHLSVVLASGATVTFSNLAGGTLLPIRARMVRSTATTAGSLIGLL